MNDFFAIFYGKTNEELLALSFVILLIVCNHLFAAIFTPSRSKSVVTMRLLTLSSLIFFLKYDFVFTLPDGNSLIIFYAILFLLLGLPPFSSWYLRLFEKASFGVIISVVSLQAIVILKLAQLAQLPDFAHLQWFIAAAILTSSILAIIQTQGRRMLAYLTASQLGFLLFAAATGGANIISGNLFMTLSFLGASIGFIAMIGALEMRKSDISLFRPSGCYESYPKLAFWLLIFGLIACGLPLSLGYIAEDLILEHDFAIDPIADFICLFAIAVNTISVIKMFLFLCNGTHQKEQGIDLQKREIVAVNLVFFILLLATILFTGVAV